MNGLQVRLLLDQGIALDAARLFRDLGFHGDHVSELGMAQAPDSLILRHAQATSAWVITLDADFHAMVAISRASSPSVLRIRQQGCRAKDVVRIVAAVVDRFRFELETGALISVKGSKVTCRRLPIGSPVDLHPHAE